MHRASDDIVCLFLLSVDSAVKRGAWETEPLFYFFSSKSSVRHFVGGIVLLLRCASASHTQLTSKAKYSPGSCRDVFTAAMVVSMHIGVIYSAAVIELDLR
jgi:hypothetical protein